MRGADDPVGAAAPAPSEGEAFSLTPGRIEIDYFDPPLQLRRHITTFFHFRCDEPVIEDIQPADIGKILLVFKGRGTADLPDAAGFPIPRFSVHSPNRRAVPFRFVGGFHSFGAALTPLGWAALTGLPADEHGDRIFSVAELFGDEAEFRAMQQEYDAGAISQAAMVEQLGTWIACHLGKVAGRHIRLIDAVVDWLHTSLKPDLDALYAVSGYSKRQTQRLVERFFGLNPRALKRKYRAVRAAAILTSPDSSDAQITAVLEHFYDQSHLIREMGEFVGRTPARVGTGETPILAKLLDTRNFRIEATDGFDPSI